MLMSWESIKALNIHINVPTLEKLSWAANISTVTSAGNFGDDVGDDLIEILLLSVFETKISRAAVNFFY